MSSRALNELLSSGHPIFQGGPPTQKHQQTRLSGVPELDQLLTHHGLPGIPMGGWTILQGPPGSGRTSIAAKILAHATQQAQPVAWIDMEGLIYPPALLQHRVQLERLLVIQPSIHQAAYTAEQILSSGLFSYVALTGFAGILRAKPARRLLRAVQTSNTTSLAILEPHHKLSIHTELEVQVRRKYGNIRLTCSKYLPNTQTLSWPDTI